MKATGIVRKIEEYGIIGQKLKKRINNRAFTAFLLGSICINRGSLQTLSKK